MIDSIAYAKLGELSEALHNCGWSVARCEKFSADTLRTMTADDFKAEQDRRDVAAAKLLPQGPDKVVQVFGCHRSTAYRRAKRGRKIVAASAT